jgi:mannose/cellobiose epimerase-like protein (N-acyl-D-glucosamine 2-epimerase family)
MLQQAAEKAREWLLDAAFPFWFDKGIDRVHGGFFDLVGVDGVAVPSAPKRVFVQARQIYAFTAAGRLGWGGKWREAVHTGLDTIERHCRHPEGGFIHRLGTTNTQDERRRDLYDQAFVAFAKAHAGTALGSSDLADAARGIFRFLDASWLRAPAGYWEGELPAATCRRQNPHMHLFEAALAIIETPEATTDDLSRAEDLAALFSTHFFDHKQGVLPEYFHADWEPISDGHGFCVEPGHHFEWVWLLGVLKAKGGRGHAEIMQRLWQFAQQYGIDRARNVAIDEIDADGRPRSLQARLWPQTERIKAALILAESRRSTELLAEAVVAYEGLQPFLATPAAGAYFDKMLPEGGFFPEPARASSLYHIVCAYQEIIRLATHGA